MVQVGTDILCKRTEMSLLVTYRASRIICIPLEFFSYFAHIVSSHLDVLYWGTTQISHIAGVEGKHFDFISNNTESENCGNTVLKSILL